MIKLDTKYVLHIPCYKHDNNHNLIKLNMKEIIADLIEYLEKEGYDSLYTTKIKSYYKNRCFDEILITIFTSSDNSQQETPGTLFKRWFKEKNNILEQEALAYEYNNTMLIENLK